MADNPERVFRILVAEDNHNIVEMLKFAIGIVSDPGLEWRFATCVEGVSEVLHEFSPDLCLLDLHLDRQIDRAIMESWHQILPSGKCVYLAYSSSLVMGEELQPYFEDFVEKTMNPLTVIKLCRSRLVERSVNKNLRAAATSPFLSSSERLPR